MKKITFVLIIGLIILIFLNQKDKGVKYNVVLITLDTTRVDKFGVYGSDVKTPNFDSLSNQSILFLNHYTPINCTIPSHTTIFSGLYPKNHGVYDHNTKVPKEIPTLDTILQKEGYKTGAFVTAKPLKKMGVGRSFEVYFATDNGNELIVKENIKWLKSTNGKPFFMWLHIFAPHIPYWPPEEYKNLYKNRFKDKLFISGDKMNPVAIDETWDLNEYIANYEGEISYTDFLVGKVLSELKKTKQFSKSIIIITADHGESLGEHEIYNDHQGLYNEMTKIPLLIYVPEIASKKIQDITSNIDIAPTILDLLNIPQNKWPLFEGISLKSIILKNNKLTRNNIFFEECLNLSKGILENQYKFIYRWEHVNNLSYPKEESNTNKVKLSIKHPIANTIFNYADSEGKLFFQVDDNIHFPENQKFRFHVVVGDWEHTTLPVSNRWMRFLSFSTWNGLSKKDIYVRAIPENNKHKLEKSDFIHFKLSPVEKDYYELYNLENDSNELINLFSEKKELSNKLMEMIKNWEGKRIYSFEKEKGKSSIEELDQLRALGYLQ